MNEITALCKVAVESALEVRSTTPISGGIRIDDGPLKGYVVLFSLRVLRVFEKISNDAEASWLVTAVSRAIRDDAGYIAKTNQVHQFRGIKVYRPNRSKRLTINAKLLEQE
ncbi:hypothetical protein [Burkholderia gladioli]|uniref:hypothetical protein n=1 Tax=Burkholderia gladioli TaxID=28095 RepID=UPI001640EE11|nr:hypothetical protein [Burkholderia gladioli]